MRSLALLMLALLASPGPKAPTSLGLTVAGDTLTARWVWKAPGLFATDTGVVAWSQRAFGATVWTTLSPADKTRLTSDTRIIPQVPEGDSLRACVLVRRLGANDSPGACAKKARPPLPSPGADSVVIGLNVVPNALDGQFGSTALICPMVQFADGTKGRVAPWSPACESAFLAWAAS